ncbi:MAG: XDD3 family exosortase-dependent surface protein [Spirulinaceae cyanobacterium]
MISFKKLALTAAGSGLIALGLGFAEAAQAFSWNYTADSFADGTGNGQVGGDYEIFGTAYAQKGNRLYIGINSNLAKGGVAYNGAADGNINYGDFFFNFSGKNFNTAMKDGDLFAVKFAEGNDSGATELGLYGGVQAKSVTKQNSGFDSLKKYNDAINKQTEKDASLGDLTIQQSYDYLGKDSSILNVIDTYKTVVSNDVTLIDDFSSLGLDFASNLGKTGKYTYGFSFDVSSLPKGDFIAHLLVECGNDSVAILGDIETQDVPEPATAASLAVFGLGLAMRRRQRRQA